MRGLVLTAMPEEGNFWRQSGCQINLERPFWKIAMPWGDLYYGWTGIGKIAATYHSQLWIDHLNPDWVVMSGTSGAVGEMTRYDSGVVLGTSIVDIDFGMFSATGPAFAFTEIHRDINDQLIPLEFPGDRNLSQDMNDHWQGKMPLLPGIIATSDLLPNTSEQIAKMASYGIAAVACEDAAVAFVCWQNQIPQLSLRVFSNVAGEDFGVSELVAAGDQLAQSIWQSLLRPKLF